jgi:hypothetical protein
LSAIEVPKDALEVRNVHECLKSHQTIIWPAVLKAVQIATTITARIESGFVQATFQQTLRT